MVTWKQFKEGSDGGMRGKKLEAGLQALTAKAAQAANERKSETEVSLLRLLKPDSIIVNAIEKFTCEGSDLSCVLGVKRAFLLHSIRPSFTFCFASPFAKRQFWFSSKHSMFLL